VRRETGVTVNNTIINLISIHSLRAEGDTNFYYEHPEYAEISIHSLRAEGDDDIDELTVLATLISIHSLRAEGDLSGTCWPLIVYKFQSTPSVRRETVHFLVIKALEFDFNPLPPCGGRRLQ